MGSVEPTVSLAGQILRTKSQDFSASAAFICIIVFKICPALNSITIVTHWRAQLQIKNDFK